MFMSNSFIEVQLVPTRVLDSKLAIPYQDIKFLALILSLLSYIYFHVLSVLLIAAVPKSHPRPFLWKSIDCIGEIPWKLSRLL